MLLLQSHDRYDDVLLLDCSSGQLTERSRAKSPELAGYPVRGHFTRSEGQLILFYRRQGELHFALGGADVVITPETVVTLYQDATKGVHRLDVVPLAEGRLQWTYEAPEICPPLESDPTAFVEREQFDFGLFVFNVTNDPERRRRIYR